MKIITLFFSVITICQFADAQVSDTNYIAVDSVKLFTILTQSLDASSGTIAIIHAGSGPTDNNGNQVMLNTNCLKYLSDGLVHNNIATLRFDKRGIANSSYPNMSEEDLTPDVYANDLSELIEYCRKRGYKKIFVIGHSEGSLIAMIILQKTNVSGFISLSGAGNSADVLLKKQLKPQLPPVLFEQVSYMIDSLKNHQKLNFVNPQLYALFRPSVQPYMMSYLGYNPAELIKNIQCPVFIVHGDKDIQVEPEEYNLLVEASPESRSLLIKKKNHVLKTIKGDSQENIASYSNPDLPVNEELIKGIVDFIEGVESN